MYDIFSVKDVPPENLMPIPNRISFQNITLGKLLGKLSQYEEIEIQYKHPLLRF